MTAFWTPEETHPVGTLVPCHWRCGGSVTGQAGDPYPPPLGEGSCCQGTSLQNLRNFWIRHYCFPAVINKLRLKCIASQRSVIVLQHCHKYCYCIFKNKVLQINFLSFFSIVLKAAFLTFPLAAYMHVGFL